MANRPLTTAAILSLAYFSFIYFGCASAEKKVTKDYVTLGNDYAQDGLIREAIDAYKKALAKNPSNELAHRNIGIVYVKAGDYKAAIKHLEKSVGQFNNNYEANFYLAESYRAQEQFAEAIYRYQRALRIRSNDTKAMKALAWSYFKIRFYSEALETAKNLVEIAPQDGQAAIILARTYLKLKQVERALTIIRKAKVNSEAENLAYFESVEGDILFAMGDYTQAENIFRTALKSQPLLAGALLGLGKCSLQLGDVNKATKYMEQAVRIRPQLTEALYLLGKTYENIDRAKSIRYYQYFRKQAATDPEFLNHLTEVKERLGVLKNAAAASGG